LPTGTPADEGDILRETGFHGQHRVEVPAGDVVTRSADEIVAATFLLSSSTPHLFGPHRARFERDLRELLHHASPTNLFAERTRPIALDIWRPDA
jgi:hypothetical protein